MEDAPIPEAPAEQLDEMAQVGERRARALKFAVGGVALIASASGVDGLMHEVPAIHNSQTLDNLGQSLRIVGSVLTGWNTPDAIKWTRKIRQLRRARQDEASESPNSDDS
ncbi:MAG TPA: hypothetical protein VG992_04125 [Candidatus Saccharimonadales bacterium]|nr:hypothetical protein [Candidatus Saccharimonadales bacterium]